jgi:hypothetical protein
MRFEEEADIEPRRQRRRRQVRSRSHDYGSFLGESGQTATRVNEKIVPLEKIAIRFFLVGRQYHRLGEIIQGIITPGKQGREFSRSPGIQSSKPVRGSVPNLMMPLVFFLAPSDPKVLKTLDTILKPPDKGGLVSNSLVYRYNTKEVSDGLERAEGTFNIYTSWLVEALTRAGRVDKCQLEEARLIFERILDYANHVGLYAEG